MNPNSTPSDRIRRDEFGRLEEDIVCRKCGYNLRGLSVEGTCPECGTAIGRSTHGDLLRFCDPAWIGTLASGMSWIVASILLAFVAMIGAVGIGVLGAPTAAEWLGTMVGAVGLVGYWKLTTPDPGATLMDDTITARDVARYGCVAGLVLSTIQASMHRFLTNLGPAVHAIGVVGGIVGTVAMVALFLHVRRLALRIPNDRLARNTHIVMWGMAVGMSSLFAFTILGASGMGGFAGPGVNPIQTPGAVAGGVAIAVFGCVATVGYTVFGLWSLSLVFQYRRAFHAAAKQATTTWARPIGIP